MRAAPAARPAGPRPGCWFQTRHGRVPDLVGQVGLLRQPHRRRGRCPARSGRRRGRGRCCGRSCPRRRRPGPASSDRSLRLAVGQAQLERSLDEPLRSGARAPRQSAGNSSPVRWTSQTSQPSLPCLLISRKIGAASIRRRSPSGCRPRRRRPGGAAAAVLAVVAVLHVGRVVVVAP